MILPRSPSRPDDHGLGRTRASLGSRIDFVHGVAQSGNPIFSAHFAHMVRAMSLLSSDGGPQVIGVRSAAAVLSSRGARWLAHFGVSVLLLLLFLLPRLSSTDDADSD